PSHLHSLPTRRSSDLNYHWKPVLGQRIKNAISTSTNGLYSIDFENIRVNVLSGNISVRNIRFIPDSTVLETLRRKGTAPKHLYTDRKSTRLNSSHVKI